MFIFVRCGYYDHYIGKPEPRIPAYGKYGLNSGVLLMRLDRLRDFMFEEKMIALSNDYKYRLIYPEQDLLNIVFHFNHGQYHRRTLFFLNISKMLSNFQSLQFYYVSDRLKLLDPSMNCFQFYDCQELRLCNDNGHVKVIHAVISYAKKNGTVLNRLFYLLKNV